MDAIMSQMDNPRDPRPCVNTDDLWAWEVPSTESSKREMICLDSDDQYLPYHPKSVPPIAPLLNETFPKHHPQLLVCHDFQGDYPLCDRWEGCHTTVCPPFLFTHWWNMDTFVYFGHKMVSIPPPAFTSIAHRHGVRVMGTLIFEHKRGKEELTRILETEANTLRTISKLVEIMTTWQFEGWLVNVEVPLDVSDTVRQVDYLLDFLQKLKAATKAANKNALVLWYDAVCTDGKLVWQNSLNENNRPFYDATDGIFVNYAWKGEHLVESRFNNGASTVCIGIDCWGRSGGSAGWECHEAMKKIYRKGLSVALFAPGWAVEAEENKGQKANPSLHELNSHKFWTALAPVLRTRRLKTFPFKTTFVNGICEHGRFFRLRDMDLQPHLALSPHLMPCERGLLIKKPGKHLLWLCEGMRTYSDLRVKIRMEGPGTINIWLDAREMRLDHLEGSMAELKPKTEVCAPIQGIFVETTEAWVWLTYFEMYNVEVARCLD